jgi:hypothetical protein
MTRINYSKNLVVKPMARNIGRVKGRQPPMTYMSNQLVPGCNKYIEISWIYDVPEPNPYIFEHALDYDKIVLYMGNNPYEQEDLGAEVEYYVGGQPLTFSRNVAFFIPKGTKHGPVTWKTVERPHLEMTIVMGGSYIPKTTGKQGKLPQKTDNIDYEKYLVRKPQYMTQQVVKAGGHQAMVFMGNELMPGCNLWIDYGYMIDTPETNPPIQEHDHGFEEIVVFIGGDADNPQDLGAEIEFYVGGQPITYAETSALYISGGLKHGPLTWKKNVRPHILMPIVFGAGTRKEARPAGYVGD